MTNEELPYRICREYDSWGNPMQRPDLLRAFEVGHLDQNETGIVWTPVDENALKFETQGEAEQVACVLDYFGADISGMAVRRDTDIWTEA